MRICPNCRQRFPVGSNFCPYDGRRLELARVEAPADGAQDEDDLVGQLLLDRYRLEDKLGEGGMGVVYAGRHVIIDKPVAVKILRREFSQDARQAERFLREAKAASRIGHPNIVDITDFGELPNGQIFFVMEFLIGHTLAFESGRPMPQPRCLKLAVQICHALAAAHVKGIVHRDLKPENIFVVNPTTAATAERTAGHPDDTIKLLDFGIAKFSWEADGKRLTRAGSVFGTPQYMAPEQAAGKDADHRVDLYALGCMLYEMVTGELPFLADTFMGILSKHLFDVATPPRQLRPELEIWPSVEAVILRAMAKDPDQRFRSAAEMGAALEACTAGPQQRVVEVQPAAEPVSPVPAVEPTTPDSVDEVRIRPSLSSPSYGVRKPGLLFWAPLLLLIVAVAGAAVWLIARRGGREQNSPLPGTVPHRIAERGPDAAPDRAALRQPDARARLELDARRRPRKVSRGIKTIPKRAAPDASPLHDPIRDPRWRRLPLQSGADK